VRRLLERLTAAVALLVLAPVFVLVALLIWLQDVRSPIYRGTRVGRQGKHFRMAKFRSMVVGAERTGVRSTASDDDRITPLGHVVRRFKVDELPQLWNILSGEMSFVGPRPNVPLEVALYSREELSLLAVNPGVTDFASIVFADEGEILRASTDPDRDYNLLIRPWKSRLGLHYVAVRSPWVDLQLIVLTAVAMVRRQHALLRVQRLLERTGAAADLVQIAGRTQKLVPTVPPGVTLDNWEDHLTVAVRNEGKRNQVNARPRPQ